MHAVVFLSGLSKQGNKPEVTVLQRNTWFFFLKGKQTCFITTPYLEYSQCGFVASLLCSCLEAEIGFSNKTLSNKPLVVRELLELFSRSLNGSALHSFALQSLPVVLCCCRELIKFIGLKAWLMDSGMYSQYNNLHSLKKIISWKPYLCIGSHTVLNSWKEICGVLIISPNSCLSSTLRWWGGNLL